MRFFIVAASVAVAMAIPALDARGGGGGGGGGSPGPLCYSGIPQCCATDVLGVADLDCAPPPSLPHSSADFKSMCAALGQRARCCAIPILGQALLCSAPV